ncbi:MAG: hypothetical protein IPO19_22575 [Rhodoferax sp.]|nr:hypothetical protein [Rhodoferax sp.]
MQPTSKPLKEHGAESRAPAQWRGTAEPGRAGYGSIVGSSLLRATTWPRLTLTEHLSTTVARAMQEAVLEALRRDVPHPNAVRHA